MAVKKKPSATIAKERILSPAGPLVAEHPWFRWNWNYSGRYGYGKRVISKIAPGRFPYGKIPPPTVKLDEPLYIETPRVAERELAPYHGVQVSLRIDIDRNEPLGVVSGTVTRIRPIALFHRPIHFIGQVTRNAAAADGRSLVVENFSIAWPGSGETVERLNVELTPALPSSSTPEATVQFITTSGKVKGAFSLKRTSRYFHSVEIEVDQEDGAINPEPYNTHTHPNRPAGLPNIDLTFDAAYRRAGIGVSRTAGGANVIDSSDAGADREWTTIELHDTMDLHWSRFANIAQWKMWVFLAEQATSDTLAGIMFDGNIDEPGGVDRQGCAVFTQCPALHNDFSDDHAMGDEAVARELFTLMVHEAGHAFNLYHSWRKTAATPWDPPSWMPPDDDDLALSWMNYSFRASQSATGVASLNTDWFYDRFEFRFGDNELLFLRHAPERFVMMGASDWGIDHGMVLRESLDPSLELVLRATKAAFELGEPVTLELRLKNIGPDPVVIGNDFDLESGGLNMAITRPDGRRLPFLPFVRNDRVPQLQRLAPNQAIYLPVNLAVGIGGCPFSEPGVYRIEAGYHTPAGTATAAVMQIGIRQPTDSDAWPLVNELFNARVGRVLYMGGSRTMEDALDRIRWVGGKLGKQHPAQFHIAQALSSAYAKAAKIIDIDARRIQRLEADPERVAHRLEPVVAQPRAAADSLGHIAYAKLVDTYVSCSEKLPKKGKAAEALKEMLALYEKRKVIRPVLDETRKRLARLK